MLLSTIFRYPVKSLRGQRIETAEIETIGLQHDRRWLVTDDAGQFQTLRQIPKMAQIIADLRDDGIRLSHPDAGSCCVAKPSEIGPISQVTIWRDTVPAIEAGREANAFLSHVLGKQIRLAYLAHPRARPVNPKYGRTGDYVSFADGFPLLLTSANSAADLSTRIGHDIDIRRFRPNLVISGAEPWAEDCWREIRIGKVRFRVVKPCSRCVVTTRHPETGEQIDAHEPLRTLGTFHRSRDGGIIFGQNLIPNSAGTICVGDTVEVLRTGPSNLHQAGRW